MNAYINDYKKQAVLSVTDPHMSLQQYFLILQGLQDGLLDCNIYVAFRRR